MLKKISSFILVLTLVLAIVIPTSASAFDDSGEKGLYVNTEDSSDYAIEFVKEQFQDYLIAHLRSNKIDDNLSSFWVGKPICIKNDDTGELMYDFPVFKDDEIVAIFSVFQENRETYGQIETSLYSETLNHLKGHASLNNPISVYSVDDGFYAQFDGVLYPLTRDSVKIERAFTNGQKSKSTTLTSKNLEIPIEIELKNKTIDTLESKPNPLPVKSVPQTDDGTFTGNQKEWCGAAVTAAIINYKKGTKLTAKSVTIEVHGSAVNKGITNSAVKKVGKNHDLSPKIGDPLSYSSVKTQIGNERPIYMQMQRSTGTEKKYHALALIGYTSSKYTIINPWYEDSLTISKKDKGKDVVYKTGSRTYKWYKSVYNW